MAYRTDGTANFNFFINRQGPRGPQGIQGPEGFSPNVQVEEDQGNTFTLRVTNKDSFFITSNLREHKEDRGGDYIRYDRAGQLMYIGDPDFATTVKAGEVRLSTVDDLTAGSDTVALTPKVYKDDITSRLEEVNQNIDTLDKANVKLTGNQTIAGTKTFTDGIVADRVSLSNGSSVLKPDAGRVKIGSTYNTNGTILEGPDVEVRGTNVDIYGKFTARGFADFDYNTTFYQDAIIKGSAKDDNNNLYLKQNTITAGDNVQIVNTADGIKISSTAQGDVTLAGDNSFTGNNTFGGVSTFNGDTWVNSLKVGTSLKNQQDKLFLNQSSITAGDNVTIEETVDGIKISSTGGGSSEPPANMVTTDTEQTITGGKTFDKIILPADSLNKGIYIEGNSSPSINAYYGTLNIRNVSQFKCNSLYVSDSTKNGQIQIGDFPTTGFSKILFTGYNGSNTALINAITHNVIEKKINVGDDLCTTVISGQSIVNKDDKLILNQSNVTAGSDNLLITETTDGVQITCNAPTNEQIEILQRLINDLSTKIDNLTNRVRDLETQIDGGIA